MQVLAYGKARRTNSREGAPARKRAGRPLGLSRRSKNAPPPPGCYSCCTAPARSLACWGRTPPRTRGRWRRPVSTYFEARQEQKGRGRSRPGGGKKSYVEPRTGYQNTRKESGNRCKCVSHTMAAPIKRPVLRLHSPRPTHYQILGERGPRAVIMPEKPTWMGLVTLPTLWTASTPKCAVTRRLLRSWPVFSSPVNTRWHCRSLGIDTGARAFAWMDAAEGRPSKSHSWRKIGGVKERERNRYGTEGEDRVYMSTYIKPGGDCFELLSSNKTTRKRPRYAKRSVAPR